MSLSMYDASVPVLSRMLSNLSTILKKAEEHAVAKKIDPAIFINARLAPDMFALARQVQIASDTAKGCVARLAAIEVPSYPDTETTFAELQQRIAKTIQFITRVNASQINGSETQIVTLPLPGKTLEFNGQTYLLNFVMPNFFFHMTTAYAILRHHGIALEKMDYIGSYR